MTSPTHPVDELDELLLAIDRAITARDTPRTHWLLGQIVGLCNAHRDPVTRRCWLLDHRDVGGLGLNESVDEWGGIT